MNLRGAIVGQASEQFGLYPLLRHFINVIVGGDDRVAASAASFLAGCKVVDLLRLPKLHQLEIADAERMLTEAISDFMEKHKAAYGTDYIRPKHHWMFDVAISAFRHGMIIDMWIIERLHLRVKKEAELVRNTSSFERSTLALVLCSQLEDLSGGHCYDGLRGASRPFPDTPGVLMADAVVADGKHIHVDDVLFCGSEAGVCLACLCGDDGALAVLVERLVLVAELSPQSAAWRQSAERIVWSAGAVDVATAWREERRSLSISLVVIRI